MTTTTELANRVLATLEEARTDNVVALLNTIAMPRDDPKDIANFAAALAGLLQIGQVAIGTEEFSPRNEILLDRSQAKLLIEQFGSMFGFDTGRRKWTVASGDIHRQRLPFVRLTSSGLAEAEKLLAARGYSWWTRA